MQKKTSQIATFLKEQNALGAFLLPTAKIGEQFPIK